MVLYYNLMGPPLYTQSVVDRNIVMWRIPACARAHTQKKYNMPYNYQKHTIFFPPGDMCNQLHHHQYTQSSETWQHKACTFGQKILSYPSAPGGLAVYFKASMGNLPVTESLLHRKI
jgi:hypothetical protein